MPPAEGGPYSDVCCCEACPYCEGVEGCAFECVGAVAVADVLRPSPWLSLFSSFINLPRSISAVRYPFFLCSQAYNRLPDMYAVLTMPRICSALRPSILLIIHAALAPSAPMQALCLIDNAPGERASRPAASLPLE